MPHRPLANRIAIICGGSKGIGLETARRMIELGASVCLVARDAELLGAVSDELRKGATDPAQFVDAIAVDATDIERLEPALEAWIARRGVPYYLINLVGSAYPQYIERLALEDFRRSMDINYFGQLIPMLILLPHFRRAGRGHVANVSSMMGYFGIMGYAAYAPAKFAINGLTEVLRNELEPHGIRLSILFPPDTLTPGYELENQSKPLECARMSAAVAPMSARAVAHAFVAGLLRGSYQIHPGQSALVWRLHRFLPGLLRWINDRQHRRARRALSDMMRAR